MPKHNELPHTIEYDPDDPQRSIEQCIAIYLEASALKKSMTIELDELMTQCKVIALHGLRSLDRKRIVTDFGSVKMAGGQTRVSYDTESLELLAEEHEDIEKLLWPARRERFVKEHVRFNGR